MSLESLTDVHRIAIVGGGPTGIACAKYFVAEQAFSTIDVFEQRGNVGGVWNLSGNQRSSRVKVPQTNPRYGTTDPIDRSLEFESPLYDYLETNIPKTLMAYSDLPFAEDLPLYPKHDDVLRYLEEHAEPVKHLIHFHTQVVDLHPIESGHQRTLPLKQTWSITTKNLESGICKTSDYDAVVVANGHYTVPHIPEVESIAEWNRKYPGTIAHSKAYRRPEDYKGKRVLVIGNSASGIDIASQLSPYVRQPVYLASRSASQFATSGKGPSWRHDVAELEAFLLDGYDRAVRTKTGEIVEGIDTIIFATGYFYCYPFLRLPPSKRHLDSSSASPSASSSSLSSTEDTEVTQEQQNYDAQLQKTGHHTTDGITTTGLRTHHMYKHFLHNEYPTLAMPVLNIKIIPFPLAENQAAVLARLWSGRLDLPSHKEMQEWEAAEEERLTAAHRLRPSPRVDVEDSIGALQNSQQKYEGGFHTLSYPEDVNQINSLYAWAASARPRHGLEQNGVGKLGTKRDEQQVWLRGQFADIKAAYAKHGENRVSIKSLDMLGEDWKNAFERWLENTSEHEKRQLFTQAAVEGW